MLDRAVFKVADRMAALEEKFIFTKVNGAKDEGAKEFRTTYNVIGFPTVLILTPDGSEVDRVVGFGGSGDETQDAEAFMTTMDAFAAGEGTLMALQKELETDPENLDTVLAMARKRVKRYETADARPYFEKAMTLDPDDNAGFHEEANFYVALAGVRDGNVDALSAFLDKTSNEEYLMTGSSALVRYYRKAKDFGKVAELYDRMLKAAPEDTGLMNQYAWMVYQEKLADQYPRAIELAAKAVELNPSEAGIWDTLAWLYAADGKRDLAVSAMEKAVALEPKFQEGLDKIKAGES